MADYCKVCGIKLSSKNTVDYRPGSCRDCELERKRLYSNVSGTTKKISKKVKIKKVKISNKKIKKLTVAQKKKLIQSQQAKLKKQKAIIKLRLQREQKKKKLRAQIEKLKKQRAEKAIKLKIQKKKQREQERREKDQLRIKLKKEKEKERALVRKEKERLKKEKEKLRKVLREEKDKIRQAKKAEKDRVRQEKLKIRQEKQWEKEKLKRAKEAAKAAMGQAKEAARQAAQEARRVREEAKKPPIVSVVTKLKEFQVPSNVNKVIKQPMLKEEDKKEDQAPRKIDPKSVASMTASSASILKSAKVIPVGQDDLSDADLKDTQRREEKIQKETDPIIDRYNPYENEANNPNAPRPPSPTPWLAPNFSIVEGDFKETDQDDTATQGGLSEEQVKNIIEKVKNDHKKKPTP